MDNKQKKRRSREERSLSANSRHHSSIFNQNEGESGEDDHKEDESVKQARHSTDSSKEIFVSEKNSSESPKEQITLTPKNEEENKLQSNEITQNPPNIIKITPNNDPQEIEESKENQISDPIEETKKDPEMGEKSNSDKEILEGPIQENMNEYNLIEETRIKPLEDNEVRPSNNQEPTPEKLEKEVIIASLTDNSPKEETKTDVEGEGDILDTITPLEVDIYTDKHRRIAKNFSESNRGKL